MILRIYGHIARGLFGLTLAMLLGACSKPDGERILGHWRAERMAFQGLSVPIGPELMISRSLLRSPDGVIEIKISSIKEIDDAVTLNTSLGLGFVFQFEGSDRMFFEVPLVGHKIYYRRIGDVASIVGSKASESLPAVASSVHTAGSS